MRFTKVFSALLCGFLLCLLVGDALLVFIPRMQGLECFAVSNGSMAPAIRKGDLVLTEPLASEQIQSGDVLTIRDKNGQSFFTHRVVKVDPLTGQITTKGDANKFDDPAPATPDYVVGKVKKVLPSLGWVHLVLTSPYGIAVILALVSLWLGLQFYFAKKGKHEKA